MDEETLLEGRERLLETARKDLSGRPGVLGLFLGGSLPAGSADAYSDIDLRVVVESQRHAWFVDHRRDIPESWPGFLFNEWRPGTEHCVSHFRPFNKIDIFYYDAEALEPSPWYRLPIEVLYDPEGVVAELIEASAHREWEVTTHEVERSISKGLASAHETWRRAKRGELYYAQTLLDQLRRHLMRADDWLNDRTAETPVVAKFGERATPEVREERSAGQDPQLSVSGAGQRA